jgi:hypothetical protein
MPDLPTTELRANLIKVMSIGVKPLAPAAILKALPVGGRPTSKLLKVELARMTADGVLVRLPGKTDKYVAAPVESWAKRALLEELGSGPKTLAKLKKTLTPAGTPLWADLSASLLAAGRMFEHPPRAGSGPTLFALTPPDPAAYFAKELEKLIGGLVKRGFEAAAVRAAIVHYLGEPAQGESTRDEPTDVEAPAITDDTLLAALHRLDPRVADGATVPIARLREHLHAQAPANKARFDSLLLSLAGCGVLELQSHAWPARLTDADREALVSNGRDGWFDSVALPRGPS